MNSSSVALASAGLLPRLEFQGRYFATFWPAFARGDPPAAWPSTRPYSADDAQAFHELLTSHRPLEGPDGRMRDEVGPQVRSVLRQAVVDCWGDGSGAGKAGRTQPLVDWLFRRLPALATNRLNLPVAGSQFLVECHRLLKLALASSPGPKTTLDMSGPPGDEGLPHGHRGDPGFHVTTCLALWGTGRVLGEAWGLVRMHEPLSWEAILPRLSERLRERLVRLAGLSPWSRRIWCDLAEAMASHDANIRHGVVSLCSTVTSHLEALEEQSRMLLREGDTGGPTESFTPPDATAAELAFYRFRSSLNDRDAQDELKFTHQLETGLRAVEQDFLALQTAPRPLCQDRLWVWDRARLLPRESRELRVTPGVRHALAFCHNLRYLMVRTPATAEVIAQSVRATLVQHEADLAKQISESGDMLVMYLALRQLWPRDHAVEPDAPWPPLSPTWSPEIRRGLWSLFSLCPIAHWSYLELRPFLKEFDLSPRNTWCLIDDPTAGPQRRTVVETLVSRALAPAEWPKVAVPLRALLSNDPLRDATPDAWLLAEFGCRLGERIFGDVLRSIHRTSTGAPRADPAAEAQFRLWTQDDPERAQFLLDLLVSLLRFRHALSGTAAAAEPARRFRVQWHDLSRQASDGFFRRPWPSDLRGQLRQFWLKVCQQAYGELTCSIAALDSGDPRLDSVQALSCTLFADLLDERPLIAAERATATDESEDWLRAVLAQDGPLQWTLHVHRFLQWDEGARTYRLS